MKMKIVVNIQGTMKRVEFAVRMVMTMEDMHTNEVNLIVNTRKMKEVKGSHSRILLQLYNMALFWVLA